MKSGRLDTDMNCMFYNRASPLDCLRKVGTLCDSSMERFCLIRFKNPFYNVSFLFWLFCLFLFMENC